MPSVRQPRGGFTQSGLPGLPSTTKWLMVAIGAASILALLADRVAGAPAIGAGLALSGESLLRGQVWQLVTYGFSHYDPYTRTMDPFGLAMALLMLWMFGGQVEHMLGRRRYLVFCATTLALAGLFAVGLAAVLGAGAYKFHGSWPLQAAMIAVWALSFPEQPIYFMFMVPLKAKYLLYLEIGIVVLQLFNAGAPTLAPLGGILAGAVWARAPMSPRLWILRARAWWLSRKLKLRRRGLEVVRDRKDEYLH